LVSSLLPPWQDHVHYRKTYGNDGYAFWFNLLEILGSTEGHYLDCNDPAIWEFLQAKTLSSEGFCAENLDLLAKLPAIDRDLWSVRVIWSENFVKGVSEVYRNRKQPVPQKPSFYLSKPHHSDISTPENPADKNYQGLSIPENTQTTPENPQSRGE